MTDFNIIKYKELVKLLLAKHYTFKAFSQFLYIHEERVNCLRHDVDKLPANSLRFANIQSELNIKGTYFFRMVPESFNPEIITRIAELGHEIGYHYEDIDLVYQARKKKDKSKKIKVVELLDDAIESFERNLATMRKYYPVKTICMHGSPLSPFDNKALWTKYNYRDFGIIGEPYFDIDFNQVAYYTDTGRRWDGQDVSVRDKIENGRMGEEENGKERELTSSPPHLITPSPHRNPFPSFHSTQDIINALQNDNFPKKAMLTFHPQRWTSNPVLWTKELALQNAKNVVKKYFFVKKL